MRSNGEGLRVGANGQIEVRFTSGYRTMNLTGYTVTCTAKIPGQTEFAPSVTPIDEVKGWYRVGFAAGDLVAAGPMALEFSFTGAGTINPNARPVIVPVRPVYGDAT